MLRKKCVAADIDRDDPRPTGQLAGLAGRPARRGDGQPARPKMADQLAVEVAGRITRELGDLDLVDPAHGALRSATGRAKRSEVVLADQRGRGLAHRGKIEGLGVMPRPVTPARPIDRRA